MLKMDLVGEIDKFSVDLPSWYFSLELAEHLGWTPAGTLPPNGWVPGDFDEEFWDADDYFTNMGQTVTAVDASALADALEEALADIPRHDARAHKPGAYPLPARIARVYRDMGQPDLPPERRLNPFEWFSGVRRQELEEFIRFCRQGRFHIQ
jgi:hypothetical protein